MGINRNRWISIKINRIREGLASKIMENAWISSQNLRKNFFIFIFSRKSREIQPIPPRAHRFFQETHGGSKIGSWAIFIDLLKDVLFGGCAARWSQSMKNCAIISGFLVPMTILKMEQEHPKQLHIKREPRKKSSPPPPRLNSGTTCRAWASPYPSPMPPPSTQPLPKYLSINISVLGGVWGGEGIFIKDSK